MNTMKTTMNTQTLSIMSIRSKLVDLFDSFMTIKGQNWIV